jgi:hypothetical protein
VTTYRFPERALFAKKSVPCAVCSKQVRRQKKFWQTESPLNRNEDGTVRTTQEIYDALRVEAAQWKVQPETHPKCLDGAA